MTSQRLRSSMTAIVGLVLIGGICLLESDRYSWWPMTGVLAQTPPPPQTPPASQTPPPAQTPPGSPPQGKQVPKGVQKSKEAFRSGINLVTLSVSVTDERGRYVTDLTPS